ncbi:MAG: hypothetical protein AAB257_00585, partial [Nitrospinota bacterium]
MRSWKIALSMIILIMPLYLAFTSHNIEVAQANSGDNHESAEHKALESSSDHEILEPRVPADKLAEAKALKNTVAVNAKTLSEAKEIFMSKGTCYTCHGEKGKGDGEI